MIVKRNLKIAIAISAAALAVVAAIGLKNNDAKSPKHIKIGSILALTGPAGLIGQEILAGQKLATEYWGARSQFPIDFVFEDSKASPKDGLSAFKSLEARGYSFLIANISGVALAIKPEINSQEESLLAIASHPGIVTPARDGVFLYSQTAQGEAEALSTWFLKNFDSSRTVVIFHSGDEYGQAFRDAISTQLKRSSIKVVSEQYKPEDVPNMRTLVQSRLPKALYVPVVVGAGHPMAQVISVLREIGYNEAILANIGYALTGIREQLGNNAGKVVYLTLDVPNNEGVEWATKEYSRIHGKKMSPEAMIGFNAVTLFITACEDVGSTSPRVVNASFLAGARKLLGITAHDSSNALPIAVKVNED